VKKVKQYKISGMSCAACASRVEKAISEVEGVASCSVNLLTASAQVFGDADDERIISAVKKAGYDAVNHQGNGINFEEELKTLEVNEARPLIVRLFTSLGFLIALMYLSMGHLMWNFPLPTVLTNNPIAIALIQMVLALAVMVINKRFFIRGFFGLVHGSPNMDTLVSIGSLSSFLYSVFALVSMRTSDTPHMWLHEMYFESAAMILVLITVGKILESYSKGKTTSAIKNLLNLTPKTAIILKGSKILERPKQAVILL
jgi:Cu2+-exporting ATPase